MLANTIFLLATIGGPLLLGCALAYALLRQRKLTHTDRAALRETADSIYVDDEDDGCPIRVDPEKRQRAA